MIKFYGSPSITRACYFMYCRRGEGGQRRKEKIGLNGLSTGEAPRALVPLFAGAIKLSNLWPVKK